MKSVIRILLLLFFFLFPAIIFSCPVCRGGYTKPELDAYLLTIIILGSLPLLMASGIAIWIYRKYR